MARTLKKWNGRCRLSGNSKQGSANIAAYSQKQAAELLAKASGCTNGSLTEIIKYFSPCWGNSMNGIEPTEPCLYYEERFNNVPPKRIL